MEHHHKLIKSLITQIRELRQQNDTTESENYYDCSDYYERKTKQLREENARIERQMIEERRERESREYERERLLQEYEKKQRWGDEWGAERTMRQLKSL